MKTRLLQQLQLLIGLIAVLLLVVACGKAPSTPTEDVTTASDITPAEKTAEPAMTAKTTKTTTAPKATGPVTVQITSSGFVPETVTVNAGDKVEWTNKHTVDAWVASAVHPIHSAYPGSDINKCNSVERDELFDACTRLGQDQSWGFTFNEKGTWKYHNHLNPGQTGTVVVG